MKHDLYPILIEKLTSVYGMQKRNTVDIYKYLFMRTAIFNDSKKVTKKDAFNFMIEELNLTIFDKQSVFNSHLKYLGEEYNPIEISSEVMDNFGFRASLEGDLDFKDELKEIMKKGSSKARKFKGLPSYLSHLMLERLHLLNAKFGARPEYSSGIEGFEYDSNHNPFKRTLEEKLGLELDFSRNSESNTTSYIRESVLEDFLVKNLSLIEAGLKFVSRQVDVPGGFIDILAKDINGMYCIIELKTSEDKSIVWQSIHYPAEIKKKYNINDVRMITVAPKYSKHIYEALKSLGNIEIFDYEIKVSSGNIENLEVNKKET